jgi:hypothetical protein
MYNICYVYCTLKDKMWSLFNCLKQRQVNKVDPYNILEIVIVMWGLFQNIYIVLKIES